MSLVRSARGTWTGTMVGGEGSIEMMTGTGVSSFPMTWEARSRRTDAVSTPEELIAAAQATCYNMALAHQLTEGGTPPTHLETTVDVAFSTAAGITGITLHVLGEVPGLTPDQFQDVAEAARRLCTVSRALAGTTITLDARLFLPASAAGPVLPPDPSA